ncbi:MAG: hypothetical protein AAF532_12280 [Planctomycetota bacterium]
MDDRYDAKTDLPGSEDQVIGKSVDQSRPRVGFVDSRVPTGMPSANVDDLLHAVEEVGGESFLDVGVAIDRVLKLNPRRRVELIE